MKWNGRGLGAVLDAAAAWFLLAVAAGAIWTLVGVMSSPCVSEALSALEGAR